jgi:hypothetical protein
MVTRQFSLVGAVAAIPVAMSALAGVATAAPPGAVEPVPLTTREVSELTSFSSGTRSCPARSSAPARPTASHAGTSCTAASSRSPARPITWRERLLDSQSLARRCSPPPRPRPKVSDSPPPAAISAAYCPTISFAATSRHGTGHLLRAQLIARITATAGRASCCIRPVPRGLCARATPQ